MDRGGKSYVSSRTYRCLFAAGIGASDAAPESSAEEIERIEYSEPMLKIREKVLRDAHG